MTMALQVFTDVMALIWQHPVFSCLLLLLFTPPFFPIVRFFSPLLISTALFMLALFTMGPQTETSDQEHQLENWEFRRAADVKVWEDKSVGVERKRSLTSDGTWMDWLSTAQETSLAWIDAKFRNENWKGSALNDDNVSILQEASWPKSEDPSTSEDHAFAVETKPTTVSISEVVEEPAEPKSTCTALVPVIKSSTSSVHHEPLVSLQIPMRSATVAMIDESPSTDLDELSARQLVRRNSVNASSALSDIDTPAAVVTLSKSGKLKQVETLTDLIEDKEHVTLKPTTADQVDDVMNKLQNFTHNSGEIKPSSPLFKARKSRTSAFSDDDDSSGDEVVLSDDSDSESDFEIFPPVDPNKMKLHPPVKLDIKQLELKLGTSLTPPKGEITEVHQ